MWYLAMRRNVLPREEWTVTLDEHLAWIEEEHAAGRILFSGPTPDRSLGIYVIRTASRAEAEQVAASDPYTVAGCCAFDLIDWDIHRILGIGPSIASVHETGGERVSGLPSR